MVLDPTSRRSGVRLTGVDDPDPTHGEAIELLRAAGATEEEIATRELTQLAGELSVRPSGTPLSFPELAARSSLTEAEAAEFIEAAGLPVGPDHTWFESDAVVLDTARTASAFLGRTAVLSLMRRTGMAAGQLAAASGGAFRVSTLTGGWPEMTALADIVRRNLAGRELVAGYLQMFDHVLRHHYLLSFRDDVVPIGDHGELRPMCVGFVDLTSSTELGARVSAAELSEAMTTFEAVCHSTAVRHGARVVKTIGDEVMLAALDVSAVCGAAVSLVRELSAHPSFSGARGGLAFGNVLEQDGDCFGPVVNCAARLVEAALDGTVMAEAGVAAHLAPPLRFEEREPRTHRGLGIVRWGEILSAQMIDAGGRPAQAVSLPG